jgi:hypothetical protein
MEESRVVSHCSFSNDEVKRGSAHDSDSEDDNNGDEFKAAVANIIRRKREKRVSPLLMRQEEQKNSRLDEDGDSEDEA